MKLYYQKYGEGQPLIILHGLFGSSDNWRTHGKLLAQHFEVFLVDQRNHGKSGWSDTFNYDVMAEDLHEFVRDHQLQEIMLMGHSLGGKTALRYAQKYPETIHQLIVVDMGVKENVASHHTIIEGLKAIHLEEIHTRKEAAEVLANYMDGKMLQQFLLKNLYWKEKGQLAWRINLPVLSEKYEEILKAIPQKETNVPVTFIAGENSTYISPEDYKEIKAVFPLAQFTTIKNAGHWIHADQPEAFMEKLKGILKL